MIQQLFVENNTILENNITLYPQSILNVDTLIKNNSIVNKNKYENDYGLTNELVLTASSKLSKGSIISKGSYIIIHKTFYSNLLKESSFNMNEHCKLSNTSFLFYETIKLFTDNIKNKNVHVVELNIINDELDKINDKYDKLKEIYKSKTFEIQKENGTLLYNENINCNEKILDVEESFLSEILIINDDLKNKLLTSNKSLDTIKKLDNMIILHLSSRHFSESKVMCIVSMMNNLYGNETILNNVDIKIRNLLKIISTDIEFSTNKIDALKLNVIDPVVKPHVIIHDVVKPGDIIEPPIEPIIDPIVKPHVIIHDVVKPGDIIEPPIEPIIDPIVKPHVIIHDVVKPGDIIEPPIEPIIDPVVKPHVIIHDVVNPGNERVNELIEIIDTTLNIIENESNINDNITFELKSENMELIEKINSLMDELSNSRVNKVDEKHVDTDIKNLIKIVEQSSNKIRELNKKNKMLELELESNKNISVPVSISDTDNTDNETLNIVIDENINLKNIIENLKSNERDYIKLKNDMEIVSKSNFELTDIINSFNNGELNDQVENIELIGELHNIVKDMEDKIKYINMDNENLRNENSELSKNKVIDEFISDSNDVNDYKSMYETTYFDINKLIVDYDIINDKLKSSLIKNITSDNMILELTEKINSMNDIKKNTLLNSDNIEDNIEFLEIKLKDLTSINETLVKQIDEIKNTKYRNLTWKIVRELNSIEVKANLLLNKFNSGDTNDTKRINKFLSDIEPFEIRKKELYKRFDDIFKGLELD